MLFPKKQKWFRIRIELQKSKRSLLMKCLFYWGMTTNAVTTCTCTVPYYTVSSWAKYFCSPITVNKTFSVRFLGISARKCGHCAELVTFYDRRIAWTMDIFYCWNFYIVLTSTHTIHIYLHFSTLNGPNSWHSYGKFLCKKWPDVTLLCHASGGFDSFYTIAQCTHPVVDEVLALLAVVVLGQREGRHDPAVPAPKYIWTQGSTPAFRSLISL